MSMNNKSKEESNLLFTLSRNFVIFNAVLLLFGIILSLFNLYIITSYPKSFYLLKSLRTLFDGSLNLMVTYTILQTAENFSFLYNLILQILCYNNLLLMSNLPSIFPFMSYFLPNPGIFDFIVGMSFIIFSSINLIMSHFEILRQLKNPIDVVVINLVFSFAVLGFVIGIFYVNMFAIGFCGLVFILLTFFLITENLKKS